MGVEAGAIYLRGLLQHGRCQVRGERVRQAHLGGELCTVERRPQNHQGHVRAFPRIGFDSGDATVIRKVSVQLHDVFWETVSLVGVSSQRPHGGGVSSRRAPQPQVDASGIQGFKRPELFRHDEGRMVGEHDAAGTDADAVGVGGDVLDQQCGRRGSDGVHVVVLGVPHPHISQSVGGLRQTHAAGDDVCGGDFV